MRKRGPWSKRRYDRMALPQAGEAGWDSRSLHLGQIARAALAAALIAGLWALAAGLLRKPFLPNPDAAFARFLSRLADGSLLLHLGASARRIGLALLFAGPLAVGLGLAAGRSRRLDAFLSPFVYLLHPLPKVAFLPIIMLFFGLGDPAKVILIGLIIFGQILVAARDAAKAVDASLVESVTALGATRLDLIRHVVFPASLPALLTALRVGLGTAIAVLFLAETFATDSGLGYYVMDAWARVDYPDMYAAIIALACFGLLIYAAIDILETRLCRWRKVD
jgi:NitT/TauT family transport system permease protein